VNQLATVERHGAAAEAVPASQYLTFVLGEETYAIGTLAIKEIIEHGQMTRVPMMPQSIRGVINVRGAAVPVIDLGVQFGTGATAIGRRTCVVIVEVEGEAGVHDVGILVDAVNEVMEIAAADIEPPPAFGAKIRTDFIAGMCKLKDKFVVILDPARVLPVDEMAAIVQAAGNVQQEAA